MIHRCVAHPFGTACSRSSRQAALLEPDGGTPPLPRERKMLPQSKKPTIRSVLTSEDGSGLTRAIPGARPAGYPARLSNQGPNRAAHHRIKQKAPSFDGAFCFIWR
jgi:hypothetical protein